MNGQLTIIGLFIVRWNVWGPLVNVGGATEVLSLQEPLVVATPSILAPDQAVGISHHGLLIV
jgi:hypothetical protein